MGHQEQLKEIMLASYRDRLGANIGIDADTAFIVDEFPRSEFGEPDSDLYNYEDFVRELEQRPDYSGYLARKHDFLSQQSDDWKRRFTVG
jgi:hypothetical protein